MGDDEVVIHGWLYRLSTVVSDFPKLPSTQILK